MIEECNFKYNHEEMRADPYANNLKYTGCVLSGKQNYECPGEENCITFQTYKLLNIFLQRG